MTRDAKVASPQDTVQDCASCRRAKNDLSTPRLFARIGLFGRRGWLCWAFTNHIATTRGLEFAPDCRRQMLDRVPPARSALSLA